MTTHTLLVILFGIAAVLRVAADALAFPTLDFIATPLATILVIAIAWTEPGDDTDSYRRFVLAGLLFSLIGDVYLVLPNDHFLSGLVAFLFAHLSYIVAFTRDGGFTGSPVVSLPLAIAGSLVLTVMLPGLGAFALPVFIYMLVILTMAMQAIERWRRRAHGGAQLAAVGAILFVISDASLGITRFAGGFPGSGTVVLATYLMAQFLIAKSAGLRWLARTAGRPAS